jgi:hypothetical protein
LRATGVAGEFPVFNAVSYSSSFEPAPTDVASPTISLPGCVRPDTTPPMIATVAANPATLAPPNHQMIPVSVSVSATDDTSLPACAIAGVTSNEASSPGESDWMITGPLTMRLRSERDAHGTGRIYSIRVRCVDAAGNAASALTTVSVPKSQKK